MLPWKVPGPPSRSCPTITWHQASPVASFVASSPLALVPGAVRAQGWTVRCFGGTSVWFLRGCSLSNSPFLSVEASYSDLPSLDESGTRGVVGEAQRYPLGRWTQNYLPVDAEIGAPLD